MLVDAKAATRLRPWSGPEFELSAYYLNYPCTI